MIALARRPLAPLEEARNDATTLAVFDFDGTLFHTPEPEQGKPAYERATGKPWPHEGWWGEPASLEPPLTWSANKSVVDAYRRAAHDPSTRAVVVTGRPAKEAMIDRVKTILAGERIKVTPGESLLLKPMRVETLSWKMRQIADLLRQMPRVRKLVVYEDRPEHAASFEAHDFGIDRLHVEVHRIPAPDVPEGHWVTIKHHHVFVAAG